MTASTPPSPGSDPQPHARGQVEVQHYLQYHSDEQQGGPPSERSVVLTSKAPPSDTVGSFIWLVRGEGLNPRKHFYLQDVFIASEVIQDLTSPLPYRITGQSGPLSAPSELPKGELLEEIQRATGRFAFGFTRITDRTSLLQGLRALVR